MRTPCGWAHWHLHRDLQYARGLPPSWHLAQADDTCAFSIAECGVRSHRVILMMTGGTMSGAAGWVSGSAARLAHLHPAPARLYPPSGRELQRRGSGSASPLFQLAVFAGCPPLTVKGTLRGPTSPCGCPMSTDREVGGGRARSLGTARGCGQGMAGQQHSMTVGTQRKLGAAQPCLGC